MTTPSIRGSCWRRWRRACRAAGVARARARGEWTALELDGAGRARERRRAERRGDASAAGAVVLAAGAWTGQIDGLPAEARVPVRPVKGQILRLRDPAGPGLLSACVRLRGRLPRAARRRPLRARRDRRGARLRAGADRGRRVRAAARRHELCPASASSRSRSCRVGLRPGTPDNAPPIGPGALAGPDLGDRPPPQRHPARAADGRARRAERSPGERAHGARRLAPHALARPRSASRPRGVRVR